jgi:hypothetical protein
VIDLKIRDYGFKETPFLEESLDYIMRGRKKEWDQIKHLLDRALTETGPKTILIQGDYGYGKTFTLEQIVSSFEKKVFENSEKSIIASIRLAESEPEARIGLSFVTKIFYEIGFDKLVKIAKGLDKKDLSIDANTLRIFKALKEGKYAAFEWLVGESISSDDKKELGTKRILSKSSQAIKVLYDFLKILKAVGYPNLVVLIDEFEYVVNVYSEKQITTILHTFKEVYDEFVRVKTRKGEMANFVFVIAITPKGWDYLTETEAKLSRKTGGGGITPWMDRIRSELYSVTLRPLGKEEMSEMINDRIKKKRIEYKKFPYKTFPFIHPDFFDIIYDASEGIPRNVLRYCDIVMDNALKEEIKEINGEYAKKVLKEFSLYSEKAKVEKV